MAAEGKVDQQREQFLAIVSHEMRTPLTSIISFSELIRGEADGLSPDGRRYLDIIERNADRLLTMVTDLLMLARIESGALPLDLDPVDLPRLCADAVMAATPGAAKQDVTLHLDTSEGPLIEADHRRLMQVMDNLVGNAVKFSERDGLVRVTARFHATRGPRGGAWRIAVTDSGIGIPPGEVEHLFDRFTRGSNARAAGLPGSGIGLSIVRVLTEMHGGHVRVHSVLGSGTTFSVFLPVDGADPAEIDDTADGPEHR
ncbi:MAG TPA: HAMP domain-containing sensor histidine kinase [Trebonia sp.]|jgi:signal transduction histidine kinase|nr:HAMP domain-containing sensor histidine kinase [Trebonia sp.]